MLLFNLKLKLDKVKTRFSTLKMLHLLFTLLHFSASIFMVPYLQQFSAVMQKLYFYGAIWEKFALYLEHHN